MNPALRHQAFIGLGSNQHRPRLQLQRAIRALDRLPGTSLRKVSSLYRNQAVGPGAQPAYLNAVAALETRLPPMRLLQALHAIERQQGRLRTLQRWIPRTLDLDLLLYDQQQVRSARLTVPHPEMAKRNFVIYPLAEIAPDLVLPDGRSLEEVGLSLPGSGLHTISY